MVKDKIDKDKLYWFPTYYSKNKIDFVYFNNLATCQSVEGCWEGEKTGHLSRHLNVPYHPSVNPNVNDKFALGCSITYGTAMDRTRTWPALMGYENFGVSSAGIDSIFYNASRLVELFKPKTMIIMFPNMFRRLLEFERGGYFFRIPIAINPLGKLYDQDYHWIGSKEIKDLVLKTQRQIVIDQNNDHSKHSKHYLQKISDLSCDIRVSSWSRETYEILPDYFEKILPFFEKMDLALDNSHYGPLSHQRWVEKLKTLDNA
jgi:hypothetical protein